MTSKKSSSMKDMGKLIFFHHVLTKNIDGSKKMTHEEKLIHNEHGISFSYFHKEGNKQDKIKCRRNADGTYTLTNFDGDKKTDKVLTKDELVKDLTKNKELKFALDYIKNAKDVKGGRKGSKKVSRKGSKASGQGQRKGSRKISRNTGRKTSAKGRKW